MENFPALLALCAGNSPVTGEFPAQRPVTRSFDVSFDLRLNKRLSKQSWGWWFETPSRPLWCHCNVYEAYLADLCTGDKDWCVYFPLSFAVFLKKVINSRMHNKSRHYKTISSCFPTEWHFNILGNIFRVTGPLCGEFTSHRWIPLTKASDAELWCFLWSAPEWTVKQTIVRLVIWDAIGLIMTSL